MAGSDTAYQQGGPCWLQRHSLVICLPQPLQQYQHSLAESLNFAQGGCIIRAVFLDDIYQAYKRTPDLENLMMDKEFGSKLVNSEKAWRSVVIKVGHPAPAALHPAIPPQSSQSTVTPPASVKSKSYQTRQPSLRIGKSCPMFLCDNACGQCRAHRSGQCS